jgi:hypothetical protein
MVTAGTRATTSAASESGAFSKVSAPIVSSTTSAFCRATSCADSLAF